jgi:protein FRA10AC1
LWDDDDTPESWEAKLAKRYYDKLFKEYCICDLGRYKENKVLFFSSAQYIRSLDTVQL